MNLEDYLEMINDCLGYPDFLTEWEASFLDDLEQQLSDGQPISHKQKETLLQIGVKIERKLK